MDEKLKAFQREDRYIVIKLSDLAKVPEAAGRPFAEKLVAIHRRLPKRECLVIESDWPEYQTAWQMIEERMNGSSQLPSQGGEAVEVPPVLGRDHPHCPRHPLIADGFRCGADWMRRQVLALGPLYTHPADQVAEGVVVSRQLLESIVNTSVADYQVIYQQKKELRQLLAKSEGVKK